MKKFLFLFVMILANPCWTQSEKTTSSPQIDSPIEEKSPDNITKLLATFLIFEFAIIMFLVFRSSRFKTETKVQKQESNKQIESQLASLENLKKQYNNLLNEDALTGLNNRSFLYTQIKKLISEKPEYSWSLILIDVDYLKNINDEYSHQAGDDVLEAFAGLLKSIKADDDIMVRWSGEEFLWLAKSSASDTGQQHCEQLQQKLSQQVIKAQGYKVKITCSLGFTNFPMQSYKALDWDWAIKLADHALHKAKDSGRNQWYGLNLNPGKEFDYSTSDEVQELIDSGVLKLIGKKQLSISS